MSVRRCGNSHYYTRVDDINQGPQGPQGPAKGSSPRSARAISIVLLCAFFEGLVYISLVTWTSVLINSSGPEWTGSLLPTISDGFARVPAIQGVFLTGIILVALERLVFFRNYDQSKNAHEYLWGLRVLLTFTQQGLLLAVGSVSTLLDKSDHSIIATSAVVSFVTYEVLSIIHRALATDKRNRRRIAALLAEILCLPCFFSAVYCFATHVCLGGDSFASVYEYVLFFFFSATPVFRILDT